MAGIRLAVLGAALMAVALLPVACDNVSTGPGNPGEQPAGYTIDNTGCKTGLTVGSDRFTGADEACMRWEYDGESVLRLTHVNAVFNCCADSVGGAIAVDGQEIVINEAEWLTMPCFCICPYDVEYEIVNLPPGE